MSNHIKNFGRKSPIVVKGTGRQSPGVPGRQSPSSNGRQSPGVPVRQSPSSNGRQSPPKFIFTLPPQAQPQAQPQSQLQAQAQAQPQPQTKTKPNNIKPVLTQKDLESKSTNITHVTTPVSTSVTTPVSTPRLVSNTKTIYFAHLKIINILKSLVFQNMSLICGYFNPEQLMINEYYKSFMYQIKNFQTLYNENFTIEQIEDLFLNENIFPETKARMILQSSMDILISYPNFIKFINNLNTYFHSNYKLEYSSNKDSHLFLNIVKICDYINI